VIRGIKIRNPIIGPNTDGIDPTCCRNVFISDCDIATGDDCICLKSEGPYGRMGLTKNITITNCVMTCCCNGLKFGTATRGGFENITFSNSVIYNEDVALNARVIAGIAIEMVDGGWVDGVAISNIRMQRVRTPIFVRLGARREAGRLRGVMIDNVHATGAILTSSITGIPGHSVEDVSLTNIRIESEEVDDLRVDRLDAAAPDSTQPLVRLVNARHAVLDGCVAPKMGGAAVEVSGAESGGIRLLANDFTRAAKVMDVKGGTRANAVSM
jgi:Glycosyl hydrolases family 28